MRKFLAGLSLVLPILFMGCRVEKIDTGPSWNVDLRFPIGDSAESFYNIARFAAGKDSVKIIRQGDEVYWLETGDAPSDTLTTPDSLITIVFVDFNKPKEIVRGEEGLILRDVYAIVRLYLDTVKADVDLTLKARINFLESGMEDSLIIQNLQIPANTHYYEYRIDNLYIKAESTVVTVEAYGNSTYTGDVLITDSARLEVYAPMHLEAHDTLEINGRFDFVSDSLKAGNASVSSATLYLFMRRSIPLQFRVDAWLVDTTTFADSLVVGQVILNDPPKDASGYSTGFVYDTVILELDTADINFVNQHAGKLRVAVRGLLPGDPVSPYKAYAKAEDSLAVWGFVKVQYDINSGGVQ